jgi:signal transduction histidine kinase/CheY-like chemotaxis protein
MRVLLVEDAAADVRLIREMLRESPYCDCEVRVAGDLNAAREALRADHFDITLLDLSLADASGIEALREILRVSPGMPVVVLTGTQDEQMALHALRAGAQDYLVKDGVEAELLVRAMRYSLERKRLQEAERFLAEAGSLLAASLDYEDTLQSVGRLAVAYLAEFCIIDIVEDNGTLRRLHVAHADPADAETAQRLLSYSLDRSRPHSVYQVLETLAPVLVPAVTDEMLHSISQGDEHLALLRAMRPRSYIGVPMLAHERLVGALLFVSSRRAYGEDDVALAEKLAHLAALEVDNARLYRAAKEAIRARDRILGIVAHDLRNPLNIIAMGVDLMLEMEMTAALRERQLHTMRRTVERMNRLIQDLMDVGRLEGDRLQLQLEPIDAARLAHEAVEMNTILAAAKEQTLVCDADGVAAEVLADHDRALRVLQNLIDNALKFTPRGGRVRVTVQTAAEAVFSVADTGPGLVPDDLGQLFRPFWQAPRTASQGAGLGLTIARGLVEAQGGRIWAESEPGHGTTFHFTLPRAETAG